MRPTPWRKQSYTNMTSATSFGWNPGKRKAPVERTEPRAGFGIGVAPLDQIPHFRGVLSGLVPPLSSGIDPISIHAPLLLPAASRNLAQTFFWTRTSSYKSKWNLEYKKR